MPIIINPGSEIKGGTLKQATNNANLWLDQIHENLFEEVSMEYAEMHHGNYRFYFKHSVTEKINTLDIHGFTDEELEKYIFSPRIYWNGWSNEEPKIEDWLKDGYSYRIEFYKTKS